MCASDSKICGDHGVVRTAGGVVGSVISSFAGFFAKNGFSTEEFEEAESGFDMNEAAQIANKYRNEKRDEL